MTKQTFWRTGFAWRILPILGILVVASIVIRARPLIAIVIICCSVLLPFILARSLQYLVIDQDEITIGTRFLSKVTMRKDELVDCRRIRFSTFIALYVNVLRLLDERLAKKQGPGLVISPYGWGRHRQELFALLGQWLMTSRLEIDRETENFIAKFS